MPLVLVSLAVGVRKDSLYEAKRHETKTIVPLDQQTATMHLVINLYAVGCPLFPAESERSQFLSLLAYLRQNRC